MTPTTTMRTTSSARLRQLAAQAASRRLQKEPIDDRAKDPAEICDDVAALAVAAAAPFLKAAAVIDIVQRIPGDSHEARRIRSWLRDEVERMPLPRTT